MKPIVIYDYVSAYPAREPDMQPKDRYRQWVRGVLFARTLMLEPNNTVGIAIDPTIVARHDKRAAELVRAARKAHDELTAYLASFQEPDVEDL